MITASKYYTRNSCLKGIEINDFVLLSKDQDSNKGNKSFLRVPLADFQSIDLSANHHLYEILPPDTPVKPYFDLEMEYDGLEQETIYDLFNGFADWLMKEMKTLFSIDLRPDDFVVLDSCRTNKLSFHLIIQTHICFKNVAEHKVFIAYIWNRFLNPADETEAELFQKLTYKVKDETRFIFDKCVYGNFQNIRLVGQSKMGKTYVLKNINQRWKLNETTIRLYDGVGDRFVAHVEPLVQNFVISTQKTTKTRKSKNTPTERIHIQADETDFITTGATLFQKKGVTLADLDRLLPYKRALYLIPNTIQRWDIYFKVACAVRSVGGTKEEFVEWAKLSTKYIPTCPIISDFHKFQMKTDKRKTYDLPLLRRLAKKANPEYFKAHRECLYNYFKLNTDGMKVIKETSHFVSQLGTPDGYNIDDPAKHIILHAYLGRGKTTAIKRKVAEYESYLFLSPRQTFARFVANEFEIPCYLDNHFSTKKLVVSIESLLKVERGEYECICIDECESIFTQFSSPTTNGKHIEIWNKLMDFIKKANKVIFADAFITNRTLDFIRTLGETDEATLIQNNTSPVIREAKELNPNTFATELIKSINQGDKNYVCYSSVTKLIDHHYMLKGSAVENEIMAKVLETAIIYHSKTDDAVFQSLNQINESWGNASLVITSPTNTVGCSYSPPEQAPDFHKVWINASPTCCVRDTFQTQMRVRHLIENKLMFCLPTAKGLNFAKTRYDLQFDLLDQYEEFNETKKEVVFGLIEELKKQRWSADKNDLCYDLDAIRFAYENEYTPEALRRILYFNLYEQTISTIHYKEMFYAFLDKCGYEFEGQRTVAGEGKDDDNLPKVCEDLVYDDIKILTDIEQQRIQTLIQQKRATAMEKQENHKYWFDRKVKPDLDLQTKQFLFCEIYSKTPKRHIFDNAFLEQKQNVRDMLWKDMEQSGKSFDLNKMRAVQLEIIKTLNSHLGIKSSVANGTKITKEGIASATPYLIENRKKIYTAFGMRDQSKLGSAQMASSVMKLLGSVYKKWTGMAFIGQDIDNHNQYAYYMTISGLLNKNVEIFN